jgi:hypothetical protein
MRRIDWASEAAQACTRHAAIYQAEDRARREGVPCFVWLQPNPGLPLWYVRTEAEGRPDGASLEYTAEP